MCRLFSTGEEKEKVKKRQGGRHPYPFFLSLLSFVLRSLLFVLLSFFFFVLSSPFSVLRSFSLLFLLPSFALSSIFSQQLKVAF